MGKVISIIPTLISAIVGYFYFKSSGNQDFRESLIVFSLLFIILPASMIWFPQVYAGKTNWVFGRLSAENAFIVLLGWLLLMIPIAVLLVLSYHSMY